MAVAASCVTTGQHALLDVLAGVLVYVVAARRARVWEVRGAAERVANSWREWRLGPLRLINHGAWAGAGAAAGLIVAQAGRAARASCSAGAARLLVAGLWAQLVEAHPRCCGLRVLRRRDRHRARRGGPRGDGTRRMAGAGGAGGGGPDPGARAPALLVQGCCTDGRARRGSGCATHPRSRVVRLAGLATCPCCPTPIYRSSPAWPGALLARLWWSGAP